MSAQDLRASVEAIRALSPRLNKLTDQANETVRAVEALLNEECSIGIPAFVKIDEEGDVGYYLEYRRIGPRFRIAYVCGNPDNEVVKAFADCPRQVKLDSIGKLPDLLKEIAQKVNERLASAENAVVSVTEVLESLQQKNQANDSYSDSPDSDYGPATAEGASNDVPF